MASQTSLSIQNSEALRSQIEAALERCVPMGNGCPDRLGEAIRYSLLAPGKRMRPLLTFLAAEACGGTIDAALPAACAVEMVHAYSLVHDDLPAMDDDDLRRGRPTCHKVFGEGMAILAGDALLTLAFETLAKGVRPASLAGECCAALAEAAGAGHLVGGQADDICGGPTPTLEALESMHQRKTGAMIVVSLKLGAMTAGADSHKMRALAEYGRRVGLAFQIVDDVLDVRGDEEALGKRAQKDAQDGKLTFPGLLGMDASVRRAEGLIAEAIEDLAPFGPRAASLEALARYVVERNH